MKRYKKRYMPVNTAQNEHWGMANAPDLGIMIIVRLLSTRAFWLVSTTKSTRAWEPALLWNQLRK